MKLLSFLHYSAHCYCLGNVRKASGSVDFVSPRYFLGIDGILVQPALTEQAYEQVAQLPLFVEQQVVEAPFALVLVLRSSVD